MTEPRPCALCGEDLELTELVTCTACLAGVRADLAGIRRCYLLLPAMLGQPAAVSLGTVMGIGNDEAPIPGGDALVMLGPGTAMATDGRPFEGDPDDPPVVAFELATWCEDWAGIRREHRWPITVPGCVAWLGGARLSWAGSYHPAFGDFATEMARILGRLEAATGMLDTPEHGASCPYCGTTLQRAYSDTGRRCSHRRPDWRLGTVALPSGHLGPQRLETVPDRDVRMAAWAAEHARCDLGGRVDDWSCPRCRRAFDRDQYTLALAGTLQRDTPLTG